MDKDEQIIKVVSVDNVNKGYLYYAFENGNILKIDLSKSNIASSSYKCIKNAYSMESKLLDICYSETPIFIFMQSSEGQGVIMSSDSFNGKKSCKSNGDTGIKLTEGSKVVGCILDVKEDDKFILITNNNKSREIYLDDVASKVDDTQLFKKLKGNGNRSRQGFMIWNMRSYKNNEEITNFEII